MNCILDTHVLIFLGCGYDNRIGRKALDVYKDPKSKIFVSQISFWEMAIKINIGKLKIPIGLKNVIIYTRQAEIETIPVRNSHILYYQSLILPDIISTIRAALQAPHITAQVLMKVTRPSRFLSEFLPILQIRNIVCKV